ncbi:hypothetical protein [Umezawaea sp. NPDC059074]|uniref:hypothetical protein n=1 Tax=Umezawaea sp. NPDC059074 TaxID=3346716 RepID=UPI00368ED81D
MLLAEHVPVPLDPTRALLRANPEWGAEEFTAESVPAWPVDWPNFLDEYPSVTGDLESWPHRSAVVFGD